MPKTITVPDIDGPTVQLCYKQAKTMERCDRRKGHGGLHTWEMGKELRELRAAREAQTQEVERLRERANQEVANRERAQIFASQMQDRFAGISAELVDSKAKVTRLSDAQQTQRKEICICAAVRFSDGRIVRGHRHDSCFRTAEGWTPRPDFRTGMQGFITSLDRFVSRHEGAELQLDAGILSAHTGKPVNELLFSEDLYFDAHDREALK